MCDECAPWRAAYLATLTAPQRTALQALADLSHGYGAAVSGADSAGWVPLAALDGATRLPMLHILAGLLARDLVEFDMRTGCYRLLPFGAAAVQALRGEG